MQNSGYIIFRGEKFNKNRHNLASLIEKIKYRETMVEVGSLAGFSPKIFSHYFKKVQSVDPYIPFYDETDINSNPRRLWAAQEAFEIRFCDEPKVTQIKNSVEMPLLCLKILLLILYISMAAIPKRP